MGFQTKVNTDIPVGIEGDFASTNPYHTLLAGTGNLRAGDAGVYVGRFAWVNEEAGTAENKLIENARLGFVRRDHRAVITSYHAESTLLINGGLEVTLYDAGDFWARFDNGASIGASVYASNADGKPLAVANGVAAPTGYTETNFKVASKAEAGGLAKITKY